MYRSAATPRRRESRDPYWCRLLERWPARPPDRLPKSAKRIPGSRWLAACTTSPTTIRRYSRRARWRCRSSQCPLIPAVKSLFLFRTNKRENCNNESRQQSESSVDIKGHTRPPSFDFILLKSKPITINEALYILYIQCFSAKCNIDRRTRVVKATGSLCMHKGSFAHCFPGLDLVAVELLFVSLFSNDGFHSLSNAHISDI